MNEQMLMETTTSLKMPRRKPNARTKRKSVSANDKLKRLSEIRFVSKEKDLMKSKSRLRQS